MENGFTEEIKKKLFTIFETWLVVNFHNDMPVEKLNSEQLAELRTAFKRCNEPTIEAIIAYRQQRDVKLIPTIVHGIIQRYMPPESVDRFKNATDETRLIEDLGIDSLTMLEIVLSIEEALSMRIEDAQMREIRTLGDVNKFLANKFLNGDQVVASVGVRKKYTRDQILLALPQQPPFFFIDDAEIDGDVVRATYTVRGDEYFLEGHFPHNPIFPASIIFEALGQAACLWIVECAGPRCNMAGKPEQVLFTSMGGTHFYKQTKPGDKLILEQKLSKLRQPLAIFDGMVKKGTEKVAQIEQMMLAFGDKNLIVDSTAVNNV